MQSESNEKLPPVEVAESEGTAHVILRTNYEEEARDDEGSAWVWTEYHIDVPAYENMQADIEGNLQAWINYAADREAANELAAAKADELAAALEALPDNNAVIDGAIAELGALVAETLDRVDALESAQGVA